MLEKSVCIILLRSCIFENVRRIVSIYWSK